MAHQLSTSLAKRVVHFEPSIEKPALQVVGTQTPFWQACETELTRVSLHEDPIAPL